MNKTCKETTCCANGRTRLSGGRRMKLTPDRILACKLGQHVWEPDSDDIRFRICIFCRITQFLGEEVKHGTRRTRKADRDRNLGLE